MHRVYCILGRSASGKSTIVNETAKRLNLNVLKSYTTRPLRENETLEATDHTHISSDDVEKYRNDMVAYTERVNYCSFATRKQLLESDFYIINPSGYKELCETTKDMDVELIPVYITVPYFTNVKRAKARKNFDEWKSNYEKENEEFIEFDKSRVARYFILNDSTIDDAVNKLIHVMERVNKDV